MTVTSRQIEPLIAPAPKGASAASDTTRVAPGRFVINGRFYSQPTTGVQRYGREIALAIDALLPEGQGTMVVPAAAEDVPTFDRLEVLRAGGLRGHLWEQAVLPLKARSPVLNLCNTGPLAIDRQIVCIHDANVFSHPESYSASFRGLYRFLLPRLIGRGTALTSVSHASRLELARFLPVPAREIEIAPNGHEHVFRWTAAASRFAGVMESRRPYVLLLGSRARHKNAELVLSQAAALDELGLDLVVAGGSATIYRPTAPIERPNIHWLGFVTDDDLACLYQNAFCLAFPSRVEGFGLPLVEAMALGCPIVSSNTASMPEVCGTAALLASPDDPQAWHAAFETLVRAPTLRAELQERGRERVRLFSWTGSARLYLDLIGAMS